MPDWRRYRDFFGPDPDRDLDDEIRFHLDTDIEELVAAGLTPADARRRALEKFGNVERFAAECHASDARRLGRRRRARIIDVVRQDARDAIRGLVRRPTFAVTTIAVLAIGVGANAAMFSIVDHLFLRPPAGVQAPSELKRIFVSRQRPNGTSYFQVRFSLPEARLIDSTVHQAFPSTIFFRRDLPVAIEGGAALPLSTAWVSPTYFSVVGVQLLAGSDFGDEAAHFGTPAATAIISWSLWQTAFAGDPRIIGRPMTVDGRQVIVRGITPRGFTGIDIDVTDVWLPLAGFPGFGSGDRSPPWYDDWGVIAFQVLARVPSGIPIEQLVAHVQAAFATSAIAYRAANPIRPPLGKVAAIIPAPLLIARGPERLSQREAMATVLAALALLLLLISIANVASLLVGRALDRQRETAVRVALGMDRLRIYTQGAIESLMVAGAATITAVVAARWVGAMLRAAILPGVDFATGPVDIRIIVFTLALGMVGALIAALVPLGTASRIDLTKALKTSNRDGGGRHTRARSALVAVQAALSVVLLMGTGLLGRSLYNVRNTDLGIDAGHLVVVKAPEDTSVHIPIEDAAELARTLPGVRSVSLTVHPPLWDQSEATRLFDTRGDTVRALDSYVGFVAADAGYLRTVGTSLLRGREFSRDDDRAGAPPVMIVSEELARRVWPGGRVVGECLRIDRADGPCRTIIGVAENAHRFEVVEEVQPTFYVPLQQLSDPATHETARARAVAIRTAGSTELVLSRLRSELGDTASGLRDRRVIALSELLTRQYSPWELGARLFAGLALLALVLAFLGLYSVLSYLVTLRTRELGVRIALGATHHQLAALVLREGVRQMAIGAVAGATVAMVLASRISGLLYGVSAHDPAVVVGSLVTCMGGAALAAIAPARRAMRVDPVRAIREE